jgi:hypothetical protein
VRRSAGGATRLIDPATGPGAKSAHASVGPVRPACCVSPVPAYRGVGAPPGVPFGNPEAEVKRPRHGFASTTHCSTGESSSSGAREPCAGHASGRDGEHSFARAFFACRLNLRSAPHTIDTPLRKGLDPACKRPESPPAHQTRQHVAKNAVLFFCARGPHPIPRRIAHSARRATVLERSAGDVAFLVAMVHRLRAPAQDPHAKPRVEGVEMHTCIARAARQHVREAGGEPDVRQNDFFALNPGQPLTG